SSRDEDDINDVTSMAGVNLNEENACILATNSELIGTVIHSCADEPFLSSEALQKKILNIGKRHDITELNSDVVNLISHATQERLRGLLEKLTVIAQHRVSTHKGSDSYIVSSDTRAQLRFLEKLDHLEKQRKDEEEREMLLRAAKSRYNKEDPEQLRLKQKAKEMQQLELAQMQQREANLTALAAIGPRKKRPLDSSNIGSGLEGLNGNTVAPGSSGFSLTKQLLHPRITRVCLRDLIFCMEQEREMKHSLTLYRALLK
ncbi:TAF4B factor, partial [Syrrhaptes paradoxus]|nr:TAF4B factor [Syrrhaptes paradoxus]